MNLTTLKGSQVFLHELSPPFKKLEFQFLPEEIRTDRQGNWVNIPIVGRNSSRHQLTGGEERLSFTLDFHGLYEIDKQHCIEKLQFLKSLVATDGFAGPGRNVKLAWGDMFRFSIWIVKSVAGRYSGFHSNFNYNPIQLYVDVELELDPEENPKMADIRGTFGNDVIRGINDSITNNNNVA